MTNIQCPNCKSEKITHTYSLQDTITVDKDTKKTKVISTVPIPPEDPYNLNDHYGCAECGLEIDELNE